MYSLYVDVVVLLAVCTVCMLMLSSCWHGMYSLYMILAHFTINRTILML